MALSPAVPLSLRKSRTKGPHVGSPEQQLQSLGQAGGASAVLEMPSGAAAHPGAVSPTPLTWAPPEPRGHMATWWVADVLGLQPPGSHYGQDKMMRSLDASAWKGNPERNHGHLSGERHKVTSLHGSTPAWHTQPPPGNGRSPYTLHRAQPGPWLLCAQQPTLPARSQALQTLRWPRDAVTRPTPPPPHEGTHGVGEHGPQV